MEGSSASAVAAAGWLGAKLYRVWIHRRANREDLVAGATYLSYLGLGGPCRPGSGLCVSSHLIRCDSYEIHFRPLRLF